ncbi:MAG: RsmE family RNA methyltransferase [Deltaproteobacteria bacterium]|nr:RsmE family RNA methyltransferase [Deltaproteobacteria bacterium]
MNLLLVEPEEVAGDGIVVLGDRRAEHLRKFIGVQVGSTVKAGIVAGGIGTAEVVSDDGTKMSLRLSITAPASVPMPVSLVLAVPRPKVLTRVIETAAAFGVTRIDLTNSWRVEKAYLSSPRLYEEALAYATRFGAEQGATTHIPPVQLHDRLMGLLDARWAVPDASPATKLIAHPGAPPIEQAQLSWPLVLALGPEGGWIQRELDTFVERGFTQVSIGTPILRVEAALSAVLGQLLVLQRLKG